MEEMRIVASLMKRSAIAGNDAALLMNDAAVSGEGMVTPMKELSVKVSVIMGVYNPVSEERLRQAVDSIRRQTLRDWEMILCDDGSDASRSAIIRRLAKMDKRIILLRNEQNMGLGYSLNRCLCQAVGKYIARMDDDDISKEERLEKEYAFLERHPQYEWVGSNAELFDAGGTWGTDYVPKRPRAEDFLRYSPYIHPSVMFRRRFLVECGGYQTTELTRRCEDYELFMRLHGQGARGYNIQESLLAYREGETSYRKRTAKTRGREAAVRLEGFRRLGILRPDTFHYVLRPLVAGVVPTAILQYARGVGRGNKAHANEARGNGTRGKIAAGRLGLPLTRGKMS